MPATTGPTTTGEPLPRRGEVWWVRVVKRRPAVVVQSDKVREPRVRTFPALTYRNPYLSSRE